MTAVPDRERLARVALNRIGEPGDLRLTSLVTELGGSTVYDGLLAERDRDGLLDDVADRLAVTDPARELDRATRLGLRFVVPGDDEWPAQLGDLGSSGVLHERGGVPIGLWVKGPVRLDVLDRSVAVVGARASTDYGARIAGEIGAVTARAGHPVVSGAAFGIDVAAHRGALSGDGATVAVLACGADRTYPEAHRDLLHHLGGVGAVVSEAAPGCAPQRIRFLARNRLIAALAQATVVVEAAKRSGALNTSNWAERLNRVVLGVPGPVTSATSAGVHEAIRIGAMGLVTCGVDVLEMLGTIGEHLPEKEDRGAVRPRDKLNGRQRQVLDAVPVSTPAASDSIAKVAGIGLLEVRGILTRLQRDALVEKGDRGWRLAPLALD